MNAKAGLPDGRVSPAARFRACCSYCLCRFERQGVLRRADGTVGNRVLRTSALMPGTETGSTTIPSRQGHEQGHGDRVAAKRTAHADPFAVFGRAIRCGLDEAQHGGMQAIGLSGEIGLATVHRERVLREIVRADASAD